MGGNGADETPQAPDRVRVILGGTTYEVEPLTIVEARKWRGQMFQRLKEFLKTFNPPKRNPLLFWRDETTPLVDALHVTFLGTPGMAADLFFSYARNLPRAEIEASATDRELTQALREVWKVAFPFAELLGLVAQLTGRALPRGAQKMRAA